MPLSGKEYSDVIRKIFLSQLNYNDASLHAVNGTTSLQLTDQTEVVKSSWEEMNWVLLSFCVLTCLIR